MADSKPAILKYSEACMTAAIAAVKEGQSVTSAAREFGVPKTTLLYKICGKYPEGRKMGPATVFTTEEENLLKKWVLDMASAGFPLTKETFLLNVEKLSAELNKQFKNGKPGRKWFDSFLRRNPNITFRTAQNLTSSRAQVTKLKLNSWYDEVGTFLKEEDKLDILDDPTRIYNADESAFFLNPKPGSVLAAKGAKTVYSKSANNEKECITVLINVNAAGVIAPPLIIFQYQRVPGDVARSVPKGWGIGVSDSGWNTGDTFYSYIANVFYPWLKDKAVKFPVILFIDGHSSHLSYHLSQFCREKNIILIALYPNATHLLQPIDVAVFHTLKMGWKNYINEWKARNQTESVKKFQFCGILSSLLEEKITESIIKNGFRKCGLYPWDPTAVEKMFQENTDPCNSTPAHSIPHSNSDKQLSVQQHLVFFEKFIDQETLNSFHAMEERVWQGPEADRNLFNVWSKMKLHVRPKSSLNSTAPVVVNNSLSNGEARPTLNNVDENVQISSLHPRSTSSSAIQNSVSNGDVTLNMPNEDEHVSVSCFHPKSASTPIIETTKVLPSCSSAIESPPKNTDPDVPSPFRKALIWPTRYNGKQQCKRKREKISSVVTSDVWVAYNERKEKLKAQKEAEKAQRKELRELKKKGSTQAAASNKTKKQKISKRLFEEDSNEDDISVSSSEEQSDADSEAQTNTFGVNDYVVVEYEREYFPGQIIEIRIDLESKKDDYLVSTMAMSGKGWRWPEKKDEVWYRKDKVLEKIMPPSVTNSRGTCEVKEILKYRKTL